MKTLLAIVAAAGMSLASGAYAATLQGTFYDTGSNQGGGSPLTNTMTLAEAFLAGNPTPDATFQSTGINYGTPPNYTFTDLNAFLGADAASLNPASAGTIDMLGSVITIAGTISVGAGNNVFDVFSDDGFSIKVNGSEIGRQEGLTAPSNFSFNFDGGLGGLADFEITWFEGSRTQAALGVKLNGDTLTAAVPLPAAGFLLIGALGGLAAVKRRRKAA